MIDELTPDSQSHGLAVVGHVQIVGKFRANSTSRRQSIMAYSTTGLQENIEL